MPQYETADNRVREELAIDAIREHLYSQPFFSGHTIVKPTDTFEDWDFDVYYRGLRVGVGEVKARNRDHQFFIKNGWAIERDKMVKLYREREDDVMFVLLTSDGYVRYIMMGDLTKTIKKGYTKLVDGVMAEHQHGEVNDQKAYVVPWQFLKDGGMTI